MIELIGWVLAILATGAPAYMIWAYARRAATLNQRIAMCDPTLLSDDGADPPQRRWSQCVKVDGGATWNTIHRECTNRCCASCTTTRLSNR